MNPMSVVLMQLRKGRVEIMRKAAKRKDGAVEDLTALKRKVLLNSLMLLSPANDEDFCRLYFNPVEFCRLLESIRDSNLSIKDKKFLLSLILPNFYLELEEALKEEDDQCTTTQFTGKN